MPDKQAPEISKADMKLLPIGIRLLVKETDPNIQRYVRHALNIRKIKANRNDR